MPSYHRGRARKPRGPRACQAAGFASLGQASAFIPEDEQNDRIVTEGREHLSSLKAKLEALGPRSPDRDQLEEQIEQTTKELKAMGGLQRG